MTETPWRSYFRAAPERDYVALLSYLPLNSAWSLPRLVVYSTRIQRQLRTSSGLIGYSLRARLASKQFWTLSAWEDAATLQAFVAARPHVAVMKAMAPHMGATRFVRWNVKGSELPLRWDVALSRGYEPLLQQNRHGGDNGHLSKPRDEGGETVMNKSRSQKSESPSQLIDARIKERGDQRREMLSRLRTLVKEADPEIVEEWKWRGVPVWKHDGIICAGETYKNVVKMTFAKGAALKDPWGLFNPSIDGNTRRAIDFHECARIDEEALKTLARAAVTLNKSRARG